MRAGLQYRRTLNPAQWSWTSWRTAQHPCSAWPQGCLLPVSRSSPSALACVSLGLSLSPLGDWGSSITPHSSTPCFPPDITWYKGREQLLAGPGRTLSRDGKHLEIHRAQLSDAGSYRCVASNVAGVTEFWYSLQVTGESMVSRGRTCGYLRAGCFPPGILCVHGTNGAVPALGTHPWKMALAEPLSSAPFAIPAMQSPVFIPNNFLENYGPMDGYCLAHTVVSPACPIPFAPCCSQ